MVRLVVGEDSYLVHHGIGQVLATMPEIAVVAMCETTAQLERTIEARGVDVVITDIRMPPGPVR
jgi:DNA-binding NarL/FixJ family response regulator